MNRNELLAEVGALALKEHEAWKVRNKARADMRLFLRNYYKEGGEWFVRDEAEPDEVAAFDALLAPVKAAQAALTKARAATRRLAKRLSNEAGL